VALGVAGLGGNPPGLIAVRFRPPDGSESNYEVVARWMAGILLSFRWDFL
jgi:hypothetical protein